LHDNSSHFPPNYEVEVVSEKPPQTMPNLLRRKRSFPTFPSTFPSTRRRTRFVVTAEEVKLKNGRNWDSCVSSSFKHFYTRTSGRWINKNECRYVGAETSFWNTWLKHAWRRLWKHWLTLLLELTYPAGRGWSSGISTTYIGNRANCHIIL